MTIKEKAFISFLAVMMITSIAGSTSGETTVWSWHPKWFYNYTAYDRDRMASEWRLMDSSLPIQDKGCMANRSTATVQNQVLNHEPRTRGLERTFYGPAISRTNAYSIISSPRVFKTYTGGSPRPGTMLTMKFPGGKNKVVLYPGQSARARVMCDYTGKLIFRHYVNGMVLGKQSQYSYREAGDATAVERQLQSRYGWGPDFPAFAHGFSILTDTIPARKTENILMIGDSIVRYNMATIDAYPSGFGDRAGTRSDVWHIDFMGSTVSNFVSNGYLSYALGVSPVTFTKAICQDGSNDIYYGTSLAALQALKIKEIETLKTAGVRTVIVATVAPRLDFDTGQNAIRLSYNAWVRELAAAGVIACWDVDAVLRSTTHPTFSINSSLYRDGVHPNDTGAQLMFNRYVNPPSYTANPGHYGLHYTYYVNGASGSDVTGDGSSGNPYATIAPAYMQRAPRYGSYSVIMTGASSSPITLDGVQASVYFAGTFTSVKTGTVKTSSGPTGANPPDATSRFTDGSASFGNYTAGYCVGITSGTGAGQGYKHVRFNTTTGVTVQPKWETKPTLAGSSNYAIYSYDWKQTGAITVSNCPNVNIYGCELVVPGAIAFSSTNSGGSLRTVFSHDSVYGFYFNSNSNFSFNNCVAKKCLTNIMAVRSLVGGNYNSTVQNTSAAGAGVLAINSNFYGINWEVSENQGYGAWYSAGSYTGSVFDRWWFLNNRKYHLWAVGSIIDGVTKCTFDGIGSGSINGVVIDSASTFSLTGAVTMQNQTGNGIVTTGNSQTYLLGQTITYTNNAGTHVETNGGVYVP